MDNSREFENSEVPSNAIPLGLLRQPKLKHPGWTTRRYRGTPPHLSGPDIFGLKWWNQDWMTIGIAWAQDRQAWAAAVRDAVVAIDAGATAFS